jgi:hypothetical protein
MRLNILHFVHQQGRSEGPASAFTRDLVDESWCPKLLGCSPECPESICGERDSGHFLSYPSKRIVLRNFLHGSRSEANGAKWRGGIPLPLIKLRAPYPVIPRAHAHRWLVWGLYANRISSQIGCLGLVVKNGRTSFRRIRTLADLLTS